MNDLPDDVRLAAEAIRDDLRRQEAEVIDTFGGRLGPPSPRPPREHLITVLRYLGIPDEPQPAGQVCGAEVTFWGTTSRCVREPHEDWPHRNHYGTEWQPVDTVEAS